MSQGPRFPADRSAPVAASLFVVIVALTAALSTQPAVAAMLVGLAGLGAVWATALLTEPAAAEPAPAPPPPAPPLITDPRLARLLDTQDRPMLAIRDGRVAFANRAARLLLGGHVTGSDARVALRHPAATQLIRAEEGPPGIIGAADASGIGAPGRSWRIEAARVADGGILVALTDTSAVTAAERARADFVANASHELRTPLAAITGYLETLRDPEVGEDVATRDRFLHIAGREANRMVRLVDDLFSISRIEADRYVVPTSPVDLALLVRQTVHDLPDAPPGRTGEIELVLPPRAVMPGDAVQLAQMTRNIIGNAMKYGAVGTPITVTVAPDGDHVRLTVQDRGEGIAPDHLPRLTERFYRVDPARSRTLGGTGLGLAIVKHVVERHRGRLLIESERGVGTVVTVRLPVMAEGSAELP